MPPVWTLSRVGVHFGQAFSCVFAMENPTFIPPDNSTFPVHAFNLVKPGSDNCQVCAWPYPIWLRRSLVYSLQPWGLLLLAFYMILFWATPSLTSKLVKSGMK